LELNNILSPLQSGFPHGSTALDPLMQLVSDVMLGFEAKPHLHTVVATLDLTSAFNHVDHLELLNVFQELSIPPIYGQFYHGFLHNHIFQVRCGNHFSKWKKESCGSPQGTVSSPVLFIIYVEALIHVVQPKACKWYPLSYVCR
jgi:hypothetical protein